MICMMTQISKAQKVSVVWNNLAAVNLNWRGHHLVLKWMEIITVWQEKIKQFQFIQIII